MRFCKCLLVAFSSVTICQNPFPSQQNRIELVTRPGSLRCAFLSDSPWCGPQLHVHRRGVCLRQPLQEPQHLREGLHRQLQGAGDVRKTPTHIRHSRGGLQNYEKEFTGLAA